MRSMRYTVSTYCLSPGNPPTGNNGEIMTIGSRDKYYFSPSHTSGDAELYLMRFADGRHTKVDHTEYTIVILELSSCKLSDTDVTDIYMETGDIILGVASSSDSQKSGSGCTPYLYILRPTFKRNSGSIKNPTNIRNCGA